MQNRLLAFGVAVSMAFAPALADTTANSNTTISPSNTQYSSPTTSANAQTANVSTQINNNNLGANSYGPGITCQSAQVAVGGYGDWQNAAPALGINNSTTGVSVQYLTPVGQRATKSCQTLANEVVRQRQLDTQLTMIEKCADFARAGIVLDPATYPELSRACAGIHLSASPAAAAPVPAYPRSSYNAPKADGRATAMLPAKHPVHLSDFSPQHNSELMRVAMHRLERIAMLQRRAGGRHLHRADRVALAEHMKHENDHLRAVIAEYQLENQFLRAIAKDPSWHATTANSSLRERILSYNYPD